METGPSIRGGRETGGVATAPVSLGDACAWRFLVGLSPRRTDRRDGARVTRAYAVWGVPPVPGWPLVS
jgi:hypothetical protein